MELIIAKDLLTQAGKTIVGAEEAVRVDIERHPGFLVVRDSAEKIPGVVRMEMIQEEWYLAVKM